jgi:hypothetical protein
MEISEKFRTSSAKGCQIRQVKAIRAVARLDLMFLLGVRCPNLFLGKWGESKSGRFGRFFLAARLRVTSARNMPGATP